MHKLVVGLALLASVACGRQGAIVGATELDRDASGEVTAVRVAEGIRVTNGTGSTIPYIVWDRGFLGLLGPCDASCPMLNPGASRTVAFGGAGFTGVGEAIVYWWSSPQNPGTPAEEPKSIIVP